LALVYVPEDRGLLLDPGSLLPGLVGTWMNAETGETVVATPLEGELITPAPGDWWLTLVSPT
jgi:hypothetical protein